MGREAVCTLRMNRQVVGRTRRPSREAGEKVWRRGEGVVLGRVEEEGKGKGKGKGEGKGVRVVEAGMGMGREGMRKGMGEEGREVREAREAGCTV